MVPIVRLRTSLKVAVLLLVCLILLLQNLSLVFVAPKNTTKQKLYWISRNNNNILNSESINYAREGRIKKNVFNNDIQANMFIKFRKKQFEKPETKQGMKALFPTMRLYLPELTVHALDTNIHSSNGRKKLEYVFAIPTVKREQKSYLIKTLKSLMSESSENEKKKSLFLVFIAETDRKVVQNLVEEITSKFKEETNSGYIEIISPHKDFYPDFTNISSTFNDSKERVIWRTKQNLDYIYMMSYIYSYYDVKYYIQMEDDIIAKNSYILAIDLFIEYSVQKSWFILEFSTLGFIGKLIKKEDLLTLITLF